MLDRSGSSRCDLVPVSSKMLGRKLSYDLFLVGLWRADYPQSDLPLITIRPLDKKRARMLRDDCGMFENCWLKFEFWSFIVVAVQKLTGKGR